MLKNNSISVKISWISVLCLSIFGLLFYIHICYEKFKIKPEILVNQEYIHSHKIPFPAVTVCSPVVVKSAAMNVTDFRSDLYYRKKIPKMENQRIIAASSHACSTDYDSMNRINGEKKFDVDIIQTLKNVSLNFRETFGYCKINDIDQCENMFIKSLTNHGYCFTFNMLGYNSIFNDNVNISTDFDAYKRKKITKDWAIKNNPKYHDDDINPEPPKWSLEQGYLVDKSNIQPLRAFGSQFLLIRVKLKNTELSNVCTNDLKYSKVYFHLPNEIPTEMHLNTFSELRRFDQIRITAEVKTKDESLANFPLNQRECHFKGEKILKYFKPYTQINCINECKSNVTFTKCGCVKFSMPRTVDMKVCTFEEIECYRGTLRSWPKGFYEIHKDQKSLSSYPCNCLPPCNEIKYKIVKEHSFENKDTKDGTTYSTMNIIFVDSQIPKTTNNVTYKVHNFICDIGGLVGLFLGFSLLSVFEVILNALLMIKEYFTKHTTVQDEANTKGSKKRVTTQDTVIEIPKDSILEVSMSAEERKEICEKILKCCEPMEERN